MAYMRQGRMENFKTWLRQMFEPPRAVFRARAQLFDQTKDKCDNHAYAKGSEIYCV